MAELTDDEMHAIGDRLVSAIAAADIDSIRSLYAPEIVVWHNFDEREQTVDENLVTLADLHTRATQLQYTQIRRFLAPGGFVQQHVLVGNARHGHLRMPAMIRFWVDDGRITRLEEYLDTAQAQGLFRSS